MSATSRGSRGSTPMGGRREGCNTADLHETGSGRRSSVVNNSGRGGAFGARVTRYAESRQKQSDLGRLGKPHTCPSGSSGLRGLGEAPVEEVAGEDVLDRHRGEQI